MRGPDERSETALGNGSRIADPGVRRLHDILCREILGFSTAVSVDASPFETRFAAPSGMYIRVTPYRELFLVSAGAESPVDIRVSDEEGLTRAVDMALECFLSSLTPDG